MDTECGKEYLEIVIWDNGKTLRRMDMVCTSGRMAIDTKEAGATASNTEKVLIYSQMATHIPEIIIKVNLMAKESTSGGTAAYILETLKME